MARRVSGEGDSAWSSLFSDVQLLFLQETPAGSESHECECSTQDECCRAAGQHAHDKSEIHVFLQTHQLFAMRNYGTPPPPTERDESSEPVIGGSCGTRPGPSTRRPADISWQAFPAPRHTRRCTVTTATRGNLCLHREARSHRPRRSNSATIRPSPA